MPEGLPSGCVFAEGDGLPSTSAPPSAPIFVDGAPDILLEPHETTVARAVGAASEAKENGRTEPP
jgi:hypothetical protein